MNDNDKKEIINLIDNLNVISFYELNEHSKECYYEIRNAILAMSIDAPQESCKNTISRQEAINEIMGRRPDAHYPDYYASIIRNLPPVTPESCENAISRQATINAFCKNCDTKECPCDTYRMLNRLPSVTPKQRTGYWIDSSNGWMCSECKWDNTFDTNYCPVCGAKMEPQESEGMA